MDQHFDSAAWCYGQRYVCDECVRPFRTSKEQDPECPLCTACASILEAKIDGRPAEPIGLIGNLG